MNNPALFFYLKKYPNEKPAHLKLSEVQVAYMRTITFAKIDNHIPELDEEDVLAMAFRNASINVVDSVNDRLVLEVSTFFLSLKNYELPDIRYCVSVSKNTLDFLVNAKLLHQYGAFAREPGQYFNYSITEKGKEHIKQDILNSCPVKDGREEYVHVVYKANRSFMRSSDVACRFAILGFKFFEKDLQWRTTIKVVEVKQLLYLLQSILPSWSDMSPLFFFNEAYEAKTLVSEDEYKSYIEAMDKDNVKKFQHDPGLIHAYLPQAVGTFIVDQESINKFVEKNSQINNINLSFRVYDGYVGDDVYESSQSYDESDPSDPFYEYSDKFYDHDDPFTAEERYNIENAMDK